MTELEDDVERGARMLVVLVVAVGLVLGRSVGFLIWWSLAR